jgi:hypothetical protein
VIVLAKCRSAGRARHAEWGQLPIPQKLLKEACAIMLRISDAP